MNKFNHFRKTAPLFIFKNYIITEIENNIKIEYIFSIDGVAEFHPSWKFSKPKNFITKGDIIFERLVFSLGMAEAVSYWKATCSPTVHIDCGELNDEQIIWWKKLWFMGLNEFFYINGINTDQNNFVDIYCKEKFATESYSQHYNLTGCLVPIGGGKDSALTLETLIRSGIKCKCYAINKRSSISETIRTAGLMNDTLITAKRCFDRSLIALNSKNYLNGHTPFSAIVAFSAEIIAYINRLKYIIISNENSANECTVINQNVNHQYSKSFEFELDFHQYEKKWLKTGVYYFSFLRPLTEFQIAKMFVSHRKYLHVFRSCNLGSKISPDIWCNHCAKCLFVCLILSPFLSRYELNKIFGNDLLNDPGMEKYFIELIGKSDHKPFECVGSINEVNLAVSLAVRNIVENGDKLPLLFRQYINLGLYHPNTIDQHNLIFCNGYSENNLLPKEFKNILKKEMELLL